MNKFLNKCKIPRIPPLLVDGKFITDFKDKATLFNDYFTSQCTPLQNNSVLPPFLSKTNSNISSFQVTSAEINELLLGLRVNKAHGPDDISANMIKLCGEHLCVPLRLIFQNILETGVFPDQWKMANVTPVHKKKDKQIIGNYRPISLLPILAKVFERLIFKHLYNHLISNNLISKNQSGFRPGDSCTNQLLSLVNDIHAAFDDKNCLEVRSVYLDMSKAFDKVWHEALVFKLKQNGVDGKLLSLLQNYLLNRKQRVVLNGIASEWGPIASGVPQGSVLGPLLFLVYVNDLEEGLKSQVKFFADDTSLFSIVRDPLVSSFELNHDLDLISKWAFQWKMSFNPDPTKAAEEILFSCKRASPVHPPIYFNNIEVKRVNDHKHLGLVLDSRLSFANHIKEKIGKARKGIGVIKHVAHYLPIKSLDQIYKMHVRPHLDYCDTIFHRPIISSDFDSSLSLNYLMSTLETTQYQAAIAVTGTWKGTNRDKILEELGWETLDMRRMYRRLVQFYKIMNGPSPEYMKTPLPPPRRHLYGDRSTNVLHEIPCRTDRYRNSFYPDAVNSWNNIGPELRSAESLSIFKTNLLKIIRPEKRNIFGIHDPIGLRWLFQLRVGLSPLRHHKKSHNFLDTPSDLCSCTIDAETTKHFLLICQNYANERTVLLNLVNPLLTGLNMTNLSDDKITQILLYGYQSFAVKDNEKIVKACLQFIKTSGRFTTEPDTV